MTEEEVSNLEKMKQRETKRQEELLRSTQVVDVNYEGHDIPDKPAQVALPPKKSEPKVKPPKVVPIKPVKEALPPPPMEMPLDIPDIDKETHVLVEESMQVDET